MQVALEKLPIAERVALIEQIWQSITQDYCNQKSALSYAQQQLFDKRLEQVEQMVFVGENSVLQSIKNLNKDSQSSESPLKPSKKIGVLPYIAIPDNFDAIEVVDFDQ